MRIVRRRLVLAAALALAAACANTPQSGFGTAQVIAPGVELFRTSDQSLVDPAGPIAAYLLKLDPAKVKLTSVLSNDEVMNAERVADIAARHGAIAAVNGGFFNIKNGEPMGLLKVAGELVSDNTLVKGAVIRRGARVGGGATLLPAVEIGEEAFVGAGAVVLHDVPPRMLVVGSPARVLREVPADELLGAQ